MAIRKLSTPPAAEEIRSMVHYAKNVIEEFRRAKHYKNILFVKSEISCHSFLIYCGHFSLTHTPLLTLSHLHSTAVLPFLVFFLDSLAPPSELLEMCELSLEKMGTIFADTNVYMLHMMYQAMGVCLYMQDWDGAMSYGEKIIHPYR